MVLAERSQTPCHSCSQMGEKNHGFGKPSWNKGLSPEKQPGYGVKFSLIRRRGISKKMSVKNHHHFGHHLSEEHKIKISKANRGKKAYWFGKTGPTKGKKHSEFTKEKMRISALKRIEKQGIIIAYNLDACRFMDSINECWGLNLQHALNGGEIQISGYSLDGYDKEKNVVFEYDEPYHYNTKIRARDKKKQETILKKINPRLFIRYDERDGRLYEAISGANFEAVLL
jgi:hypothetical protein